MTKYPTCVHTRLFSIKFMITRASLAYTYKPEVVCGPETSAQVYTVNKNTFTVAVEAISVGGASCRVGCTYAAVSLGGTVGVLNAKAMYLPEKANLVPIYEHC